MYQAAVRRQITEVFERDLSGGDWDRVLARVDDHVHHVFPGDGALGGERRSRAAVRLWFERLGRLFPGHDFEVQRVVSRGWPWDTWVTVQWTAVLTPREGDKYVNEGTHWIGLRWGRVTAFHAYLDTEKIAAALRVMSAHGIGEAGASPIR